MMTPLGHDAVHFREKARHGERSEFAVAQDVVVLDLDASFKTDSHEALDVIRLLLHLESKVPKVKLSDLGKQPLLELLCDVELS